MAPERQTRNGRAFGLPGGSLPSEQKNRKRPRHEDSDEFDNATSSDEDAAFEEDDPAPAKPPRKKNTMSGVVRKRQSMGRRTAYDKPENYPSRDAYNQAQLALGAPRGCVDGVPEDYEAYIKRKKRHALWLTSLLYYRKVAKSRRKPGDLNPEGDDERPVNPRRHEAEALTDPASWPKEPNSNAEAYFDSLNRQSRYLMWVHEPGNWKGPWPPGVEPCMDINEPDPPSLPQRAQPMKPCSNCTDADPKLRCSPWRGWEYDERNRMRHLPDARCEQCKIRDLHNCEVRISHGRVGTGTGRAPGVRRVYSRRTRINRPEAVEVTQAPAPGQVYRYDDGRSDLVQRNDRLEGAIPRAYMDFSCMQCLHATSIPGEIPCSILGPPLMGEPRDQQCQRCQNHGFVCDKSEAWNNALRAESHRAAEQSQGLMNEQWLLQQPLQQPFSFQQPFRQQQGFGFDVQPNFGQPAPPASLQYQQQQQYGFDAPAIQPHPTVPALVPAFATDLTGTLEFPEEPIPLPDALPEGMQCDPCKDTGVGGFCDINTPCANCVIFSNDAGTCRPGVTSWSQPTNFDLGMDLDLGIGIDFDTPVGQQHPPVAEPPDATQLRWDTQLVDPIPRQGISPDADAQLALVAAWNSAAQVADAAGLHMDPRDEDADMGGV